MSDITDLIENRLEERIAVGKERFDAIETNIDEALAEVKPLVQAELSKFGGDLTSYNKKFKAGMSNLELPATEPMPELANDVFQYIYYTGWDSSTLLCSFHYITCSSRTGHEWRRASHSLVLHPRPFLRNVRLHAE